MKNFKDYIFISNVLEELESNDKRFFKLKEETEDYNLYFDIHSINRSFRHYEFNGYKSFIIKDNQIIKSFKKAYNKILAIYSSNKLQYSHNSNQAFVIIDKSYKPDNLIIVGFIYGIDKQTAKYDICIKTVMYNDNFKCKNTSTIKTVPAIIESLSSKNLIIIEND